MLTETRTPEAPALDRPDRATAKPNPNPNPSRTESLALSASLMAFLSACGGGGGGVGDSAPPPGPPAAPVSQTSAARFLLQAQLSASDADIAAVQSQGYSAWLQTQMNTPVSTTGWDWLISKGYNTVVAVNTLAPADYMVWNQLIASPDALRKRFALAWSEIMVVSSNSMAIASRSFAMAAYWDLLNADVFGNYRKLLEDITLNLAMGVYLNTRGNQKENPATGSQPDENYAREVLQLFSIGLYNLELNGALKLEGGKPKESYVQSDITNLARVFTGYDYDITDDTGATNPQRVRNPMVLIPSRHSTVDTVFLGTTISNTDGKAALKTTLDIIFNHPNVGPFVSKQLIMRLVTSNPSPDYVGRVASVFNNNGFGVRGDLRAVTAAVLLDNEARGDAALTAAAGGKLREPIVRFAQWARSFNAASTTGDWKIGDLSSSSDRLGQSPLRSPSVFNFFRPGYVPPNTALANQQLAAPEFQIANESTVAAYVNFMVNVVRIGFADVQPKYETELALAGSPAALLARLNLLLSANQVSAATLAVIQDAITRMPNANATDQKNRVQAAVLLIMACPEYLVQK